ncbi:MAG: ABC transporter, partial [Alphaproteobacteria bacterium]|nr:ABC transporter [Alphaproteobacteria bacterium]
MNDTTSAKTAAAPTFRAASASGTTSAQRGALAALALALAAILFIAVNVWSNAGLRGARLDLTENKLYTLSPGTLAVLSRIDEPITLRFYFSQQLAREIPAFGNYAQRVRDLIEEYASKSDGKLRVEVYDPIPFSDIEDRAVAYGLQGVPVSAQGDLVYFGLVGTNKADDEEIIPFFQTERERFLELDLTKIVGNLAKPKKRAVAIISDLPLGGDQMAMMMGQMPQPWM